MTMTCLKIQVLTFVKIIEISTIRIAKTVNVNGKKLTLVLNKTKSEAYIQQKTVTNAFNLCIKIQMCCSIAFQEAT